MTLTRTQRKNLDKLATYLEGLPRSYRHFDMVDYAGLDADDPALVEYARHNGGVSKCGTVACAVGHGPAAGILFRGRDLDRWPSGVVCNWDSYSSRFVPRALVEPEFDWAFGSLWARVDGHHWAAAARIRYLLKHGTAPEGYRLGAEIAFQRASRGFDKRHAQVDTHPQGGDAKLAPGESLSSAVGRQADAPETPIHPTKEHTQ